MSPTNPVDLTRTWRRIAPAIAWSEVVHTHAFSTLLPLAFRSVRRPWVHSEHWSGIADPSSLPPRGRTVLAATGSLLRRPDVVTAVSAYLAERVRAYRSGPTVVVPSTVREAAIVPPPRDPVMPQLVSVGGLVPGKDPFLALETVRELRRRGLAARLTWVGDGPLRAPLTEAIRDDDVALVGARDAEGVADALDAADIFVLPTKGETLCLSALEAIRHGRPVVIGGRGGPREYIESGNGRLVDEQTPHAYAEAIEDIWNRRAEFSPDGVAATISDRFTPAAVLRGYEDAYAMAMRTRGKRDVSGAG